jgi:hypothetical protein
MIIIAILSLILVFSVSNCSEMITSPPITNWGTWGPFHHCANGTVARGFQLKTESEQFYVKLAPEY